MLMERLGGRNEGEDGDRGRKRRKRKEGQKKMTYSCLSHPHIASGIALSVFRNAVAGWRPKARLVSVESGGVVVGACRLRNRPSPPVANCGQENGSTRRNLRGRGRGGGGGEGVGWSEV